MVSELARCSVDVSSCSAPLFLEQRLQHRDRIDQLLARALERDEGRLGAIDRDLGRELLQLASRLGDLAARVGQVQVEVLQLDDADLLLVVPLVLGLLADRVDLVAREVADHARLRDDAALEIREVRQRGLLAERVRAAGLLGREPRVAGTVEHAALLADHGVEPLLEPVRILAQLVGDRLHARARDREVLDRVLVLGLAPARIGEPRHRLLLELERLLQIGLATLAIAGLHLVRVRRVGHAEVVRAAEPQLLVDAGRAARLEQRLLGAVEVGLREQRDALVVLVARGAMLAVIARRERDHQDQLLHWRAPIHRAAISSTSEASTIH